MPGSNLVISPFRVEPEKSRLLLDFVNDPVFRHLSVLILLALLLVVPIDTFRRDDLYRQIRLPVHEASMDQMFTVLANEGNIRLGTMVLIKPESHARTEHPAQLLPPNESVQQGVEKPEQIVGVRVLRRCHVNDSVDQVRFLIFLHQDAKLVEGNLAFLRGWAHGFPLVYDKAIDQTGGPPVLREDQTGGPPVLREASVREGHL